MSQRTFSLKPSLRLAIFAPAISVLLLGSFLTWQFLSVHSTFKWVSHSHEVLALIESIQSQLRTSELHSSARRTGLLESQLERLCNLVSDNSSQLSHCESVRQSLFVTSPSLQSFQTLELNLAKLALNEEVLRSQRSVLLEKTTLRFGVLFTLGLIALVLVLSWHSRRQILRLADQFANMKQVELDNIRRLEVSIQRAEQETQEREHTERQLAMTREENETLLRRFELALQSFTGVVYEWSLKGDFVWRSSSVKKLLGYQPTEIPPSWDWWLAQVHPDDKESSLKKAQDFLEQPLGDTFQSEYRIKHKDGHYLTVWDQASVERDEFGHVIAWRGVTIDVTERRKTEDQYHALTEVAPQFIWMSDENGNITYSNQQLLDFMGVDQAATVGSRWVEMLHPEDKAAALSFWQDCIRKEAPYQLEFRVKTNDGSYAWLLNKATPIRNKQGRVDRWVGVSVDISSLKRAQESNERTTALLKAIYESTRDAIYAKDRSARLISVNPAVLNYIQKTEAEVLGKTDVEFLGPEAQPIMENDFKVMESGQSQTFEEIPAPHSPLRYVFQSTKSPIRNKKGEVIGLVGISRDITVQKRSQEAIENQQKWLESVLNLSPLPVLLLEPGSANIILGNKAAQRLTPTDFLQNATGNRPDLIFLDTRGQPLPTSESPLMRAARGEKLEGYQFLIKTDASTQALLAYSDRLPAQFGHPETMVLIYNDVSQLKEAERSLHAAIEELQRSNTELARFAFVASHDLKEPLRTISNYTELLQRRFQGQLGEHADRYIRFIVQGVSRMYELINDLLSYSRIGATFPEMRTINLDLVVSAALENLSHSVQETSAIIKVERLPTVIADPSQMAQLFQNLISNALKYKNDCPPDIRIEYQETNTSYIVSVSDNGIGIAPEYHEKIFVLFQRLHRKDEYSGTGIGLAVCKRIVERHGGKLWVDSKPNLGSTFFFSLPKEKSLTRVSQNSAHDHYVS